jgi:hypothetical protein
MLRQFRPWPRKRQITPEHDSTGEPPGDSEAANPGVLGAVRLPSRHHLQIGLMGGITLYHRVSAEATEILRI